MADFEKLKKHIYQGGKAWYNGESISYIDFLSYKKDNKIYIRLPGGKLYFHVDIDKIKIV